MDAKRFTGGAYQAGQEFDLTEPKKVAVTYAIEDIKRLCLAYDHKYGEYPEHVREGGAVFAWILSGGRNIDYYDDDGSQHSKWDDDLDAYQGSVKS